MRSRGTTPAFRILLVVTALGTAACAGGTGGGPTDPSPSSNRPPTVGSITVTPAFGISQLTTFSLSATGSDPDGDPLTYLWTYPGGAAGGAAVNTKITAGGAATISLAVTDSRGGSAGASRTVTIGSMTGRWRGENLCGAFDFTFTQNGGTVTGAGRALQPWCNVPNGTEFRTDPAEPGKINSTGKIEIRYKAGIFIDAYMRGQMDSTGRRITGGMFKSGFNGQPFTLTKQ